MEIKLDLVTKDVELIAEYINEYDYEVDEVVDAEWVRNNPKIVQEIVYNCFINSIDEERCF